MNAFPLAPLALIALLGTTLAGCDAAEEHAQKLTDKAGQVAQEVAREAVSDTVNALNEQIDKAQKSSKDLLGQPKDRQDQQNPEPQTEAPVENIET